jgi:hypothetical protein
VKTKIIPPQVVNQVKNTFQNPFDRDRFLIFTRNLFNSINEEKAFHVRGYVKEKYRRVIKTYERLATYTDPQDRKIDILAVYIRRESSLEYARTSLRNFVADYLKTRGEKDAALVAFVPPDGGDWRFSLVKMEYRYDENKKKIKERFTPAKRYSFLVGKHEKTHTAQSRLSPLVADDERYPTLENIEEAFSVERVTREFFNKYRELFIETKDKLDALVNESPAIRQDFENKNIDTGDFAKKLLGQIVFLYFLQRKGWFGVKRGAAWGAGSKNFLRELFEKKHGYYKNFFNDVLEPLFYQALRYDRSSDDDYFSQFDCRIPFLNGGLFDPINNYDWVNTDIELPDALFSNSRETKEGDIGTGILDIFDRYNFTVKEDEPLEKEVAVDPEMLGKVFENLLEVKDRKSKGTYYTPREIVHYMCRESMINYLATELESEVPGKDIETLVKFGEMGVEHDATYVEKKAKGVEYNGEYSKPNLPKSIEKHAELIDEKLKNIRICDPAVGSGAFLVGMMQEIGRARNALTPHIKNKNERTMYSFKRHVIQNCLYGVDIDPGAVEICKLRLWLSLIVDEEDIKQIKPLPNLDYKIVCGNSLLSVKKNLFNAELFNKLEELKPLYFSETNVNRKREYKNQIDQLISQITNGRKDFDFEVYFSEVFHEKKGFDVVIANPPYIVLPGKELENFRWTKGNQNTYVAFLEIADNYINEKGIISYIIPSTWLAGNKFKELRKDLLAKERIHQIIQLPYDIFEAAYVDNVIFMVTGKDIHNNIIKTFKFNIRDSLRQENIIFKEFLAKDWLNAPGLVIFLDKSLLQILDKYLKAPAKLLGGIATVQRGTLPPKESEIIKVETKDLGKDVIRWFAGQVYRYVIVAGPIQYIKYGELRESKPLEVFQVPKILGRQLVSRQFRLQFAFTEEEFAFKKNLYAIYHCYRQFDYLYLLAILNSRFFSYVQVRLNTSGQRDDYPAFSLQDFRNFMIPDIPPEKQKPFIDLVDKILSITKDDDYLQNPIKQAKDHEYEKQIDQLVYKLYGLTQEEIEIVESQI